VQAMPDGGIIEILMTIQGNDVVVNVTDSGEGIALENVEKIFDPFFTTKDSGTGLGLAITSKIVQAHDGAITVRSEIGKGSTFSLCFHQIGLLNCADAVSPCRNIMAPNNLVGSHCLSD